ncbi:hypothetical protein GGI22_002899, partial [Coemansia erecta]
MLVKWRTINKQLDSCYAVVEKDGVEHEIMHSPIVSDEEILKYANVLSSDRSTCVEISHYERWSDLDAPPYDGIPCIEFDLLSTTHVTKSTFCEIRRTSKSTLIKLSQAKSYDKYVYNEICCLSKLSLVVGVPKVLSQVLYNGNVVGYEMEDLGLEITKEMAKENEERILDIVRAIHAHGICHNDLTTSKILVNSVGDISIIGFG